MEPTWHESKLEGIAAAEAQAVTAFIHQLVLDQPEIKSHSELTRRSPSRSARLTSSLSLRHVSSPSVRPSPNSVSQVSKLRQL